MFSRALTTSFHNQMSVLAKTPCSIEAVAIFASELTILGENVLSAGWESLREWSCQTIGSMAPTNYIRGEGVICD